jgi:hypothetical protein
MVLTRLQYSEELALKRNVQILTILISVGIPVNRTAGNAGNNLASKPRSVLILTHNIQGKRIQ